MKKSVLFALLSVAIYSCKKEKEVPVPVPPASTTYADYSNLKTGNYWIYERFNLDTTGGTYTSLNIFDSTYVEKDTIANGNTYFKVMQINYPMSNDYSPVYLRDSLSYIVDITGQVQFSSQNFTDTFYTNYIMATPDTVCYIFSKMSDNNFYITLPAGNFLTKNYKTTYLMYPNFSHGGTERAIHYRYAKNVGLVEQTLPFYVFPPSYIVRRLKSFGSI